MKKQIFTLLTLLVLCVTGVWADTTLFLWQSDGSTTKTETSLTATGGTAAFYGTAPSTESASYNAAVTDTELKATGSKGHKLGYNATDLQITLTGGNKLQAGDIIYICGYNNFKVGTSVSSNVAGTDLASSLATGSSKSDYNVGTIIVPNTIGDNVTTIYLSRANGSGTGLAAVKIVRPTPYSVTYNSGAGSGDAVNQTDAYFASCPAGFTAPTGKTFVGWNTSSDGSGTFYSVGTRVPSAITVYAQWETKATTSLSYDSENPTTAPAGWTWANNGYASDGKKATVAYIGAWVAGDVSASTLKQSGKTDNDSYVAFGKDADAIATYDLGYETTVYTLDITLHGGSSSAVTIPIKYLDGDGNEVEDISQKTTNVSWAANAFSVNKKVEGVRYIKVGCNGSNWSIMSAFAVTYKAKEITNTTYDLTGVTVNGNAISASELTTLKTADAYTVTLSESLNATPTVIFDKETTNTFSDASEEVSHEDVAGDINVVGDYYEATATIGTNSYKVKIPVDATPTVATPTITITGATVVNATNYLTANTEVTINCDTDGATIYYTTNGDTPTTSSAVYNPSSKPTISSDGTYTIKAYAVKASCYDSEVATSDEYKKITLDTQADVTGYTKWDWADLAGKFTATGNGGINFADGNPLRQTDIVMSNVPKYGYTFTIPSSFDAEKLVFNGQYPVRTASSTTFAGMIYVKFNTTVAGTVKVTYASNGSSSRFVKVTNGENSTNGDASSSDSSYKTVSMAVEAGVVTMTGYQGEATSYVRVKTIEFIPATVSGTISASGWNTFSSNAALDLSTISVGTAYVASAAAGSTVTMTSCTDKVAAGTGLMIKGTAGATFTINTTADAATFSGTNKLVGLPNGGTVAANDNNYVFGWENAANPGFYFVNDTEPVLGAGKAYLHTDAPLGARLAFVFEDETSGINAIHNSQLATDGAVYNLRGQRVAQPTKGLYIVNGKKVAIK